ncbi:sporulation membrane protein YtaF [Bacillus horti]|uniref:Sporulation protein YtaF n=1 Tax=Caldalkalibacillus horti TaxID=77523 RepID=A0ABT9VU61_9BACI|nr:sporulation membrane protein YtaF [Bacillus horti]MDQ0164160.1 putative sporulation protein YtaF [Bacillus horti]
MIEVMSILILAFAVSLDSFGVGITYGLRKVYIPFISIFIIAICSGITIIVAMLLGQGLSLLISPAFAGALGGLILIGIGLWALSQTFKAQQEQHAGGGQEKSTQIQEASDDSINDNRVWTIEFKKLGIVVQILRKPMMADIDRSGVISGKEAFVLGIALSLDSFGAGIGAALLGYSPLLVAILIATMSSLFVFLGVKCGALLSSRAWVSKFSYAPGIILVLFGFLKLF